MKKIEIAGRRFGSLTAIKMIEEYRYPNGERGEKWLCVCDCGNEVVTYRKNLLGGNTKSCGCVGIKKSTERLTKHGGKNTRLYTIWCSMKYRCNVNTCSDYADYGGRGIRVCDEWNEDFSKFRDWAVSNGYTDKLTIDRIDTNGCYNPANCRWVDYNTQANNRRNTIYITHNGETHTCSEWSKITGISYDTLNNRVNSGKTESEIFYNGRLKTGPKRQNNIHN